MRGRQRRPGTSPRARRPLGRGPQTGCCPRDRRGRPGRRGPAAIQGARAEGTGTATRKAPPPLSAHRSHNVSICLRISIRTRTDLRAHVLDSGRRKLLRRQAHSTFVTGKVSPVLSPEGCWRRRPAEAVNGCQVPLGAPSCSSRRLQLSHLDRCGQRLSEDSETQSSRSLGGEDEKSR